MANFRSKPDPADEQPTKSLSFKQQLDKKAEEAREPPGQVENVMSSTVQPLIEKVTEYVPAAKAVLGDPHESKKQQQQQNDDHDGAAAAGTNISDEELPQRPLHDRKIEHFLQDQHVSKGENGVLQ